MPNTTAKKNVENSNENANVNEQILEMQKKNKELENKLDLILSMLSSKSSDDKIVTNNVVTENTVSEEIPEEPLANKNIKVMSLCYGSLNLSDGSRVALHFDNFGQIKTCLYSTLTSIVNTDTSFAEQGKFYICDKDAVYYLGLYEPYKKIFNFDTITHICEYDISNIEKIVTEMNESQQKVLAQNIVTRMVDGETFDLNKINIISKSIKIDIMSEYEEYKKMLGFIKK